MYIYIYKICLFHTFLFCRKSLPTISYLDYSILRQVRQTPQVRVRKKCQQQCEKDIENNPLCPIFNGSSLWHVLFLKLLTACTSIIFILPFFYCLYSLSIYISIIYLSRSYFCSIAVSVSSTLLWLFSHLTLRGCVGMALLSRLIDVIYRFRERDMQTFSSPGDKPGKSITCFHFVWANSDPKTTFSKDYQGSFSNQALFLSQILNLIIVLWAVFFFPFLSTSAKNISLFPYDWSTFLSKRTILWLSLQFRWLISSCNCTLC